jgi:tryptophan-rich sensory protein
MMTAEPLHRPSPSHQWWGLAGFAVAVLAVAVVGSVAAADAGQQYLSLSRPSWAPPSWLFGPVWTVLYILIALSGWLVWRQIGFGREIAVYAIQLIFNAAWTPLFFGGDRFGLAFADIAVLWVLIGVNIVLFWRVSKPAAWMLVPYWAWVSFAGALNLAVWQLNT